MNVCIHVRMIGAMMVALLLGSCATQQTPGARCVPGRVEACPCPSGQSGSQACNADGTFEACTCPVAKEQTQVERDPVPCPGDADLARMIAQRLGEDVDITACGAGHFPRPGWFVHAWNGDEDEGGGLYRLVLDAASRDILARNYLEMGPRARMEQGIALHHVGDFDANGVDEILELHETSGQGVGENFLVGLAIDGNQFREILSVTVEYDDGGFREQEDEITSCRSSVAVVPPRGTTPPVLVIAGTITRGPKAPASVASKCIAGRREFVLVNGRFSAR